MSTDDRFEIEKPCECGKGTVRVQWVEPDHAFFQGKGGVESVLRPCKACGGTTWKPDEPRARNSVKHRRKKPPRI